jgi:hypothetical protein
VSNPEDTWEVLAIGNPTRTFSCHPSIGNGLSSSCAAQGLTRDGLLPRISPITSKDQPAIDTMLSERDGSAPIEDLNEGGSWWNLRYAGNDLSQQDLS